MKYVFLQTRYRLRFIDQMRYRYGPDWWKFYLRYARAYRKEHHARPPDHYTD
jgi:hypothetical protein